MSLDNLAFDLSRLSFNSTPDLLSTHSTTPSFLSTTSTTHISSSSPCTTSTIYGNRAASTSTGGLPSITITQEKTTPSSRVRNRQCVPSDDEDDEDEDNDQESSDEEEQKKGKHQRRQQRGNKQQARKIQLPSDDEEDDEEDDDSGNEVIVPQSSPMYRRLSGVGSTSNLTSGIGRRSPSPQLHQYQPYQQQQQQQQGSVAQPHYNNNPSRPGEVVKRHSDSHLDHHHQQGLTGEGTHLHHLQQMQHYQHAQIAQHNMRTHHRVSGMDLLKQLEQEKAEQKRMKPKINPSHVKIEKGLLANLPEPGSHSISFQAMQKQASDQQKYQQQQQMQYFYAAQQQQASMYQLQLQQQQQQQQQQQSVYPYAAANGAPHYVSSSPSLVMTDQHIPSRPSSAMNNYQQQDHRRRPGE